METKNLQNHLLTQTNRKRLMGDETRIINKTRTINNNN